MPLNYELLILFLIKILQVFSFLDSKENNLSQIFSYLTLDTEEPTNLFFGNYGSYGNGYLQFYMNQSQGPSNLLMNYGRLVDTGTYLTWTSSNPVYSKATFSCIIPDVKGKCTKSMGGTTYYDYQGWIFGTDDYEQIIVSELNGTYFSPILWGNPLYNGTQFLILDVDGLDLESSPSWFGFYSAVVYYENSTISYINLLNFVRKFL